MTKTIDLPTEEQMLAVVPKSPDPSPDKADELPYGDLRELPEIWQRIILREDLECLDDRLTIMLLVDPEFQTSILPESTAHGADMLWPLLAKAEESFKKEFGLDFQEARQIHKQTILLELNKVTEAWAITIPEPWKNLVSPTGGVEGKEEYKSFEGYLYLGIHRTIRKAVMSACKGQYDHSVFVKYAEWSKRWQWELRANAWDRHETELCIEKLANLKSQAMYKSAEVLHKLQTLNSEILDGKVNAMDENVQTLGAMRQSNTIENAVKLHSAIFGNKSEVKGGVEISLAHAILNAAPATIDI